MTPSHTHRPHTPLLLPATDYHQEKADREAETSQIRQHINEMSSVVSQLHKRLSSHYDQVVTLTRSKNDLEPEVLQQQR